MRWNSTSPSIVTLASLCVVCVVACSDDGGSGADEVGSTAATDTDGVITDGESGESGSGESESGESDSDSSSDDESESSSDSESDSSSDSESDSSSDSESDSSSDSGTDTDTGETGETDTDDNPLWTTPSLWYSVEDRLIYIDISEVDGSVLDLVVSTITTPLIDGQNGLTMLEDGSLLGSRESDGATEIFHVPEPPTEASMIEVDVLGIVPDALRIEALYTDCEGLVYLMDTGSDVSNADGNRLIRFTGDYLAGDLSYEVITDLGMSSVADIDDMSPGIDDMGGVTDGTGFALDSGTVYDFDYNTGTGTLKGMGGTWGIHALGGPLFDDEVARLYLLDIDANLYEADPDDLSLSPVLITGPTPDGDAPPGWSGLAGPLTECETSIIPQ